MNCFCCDNSVYTPSNMDWGNGLLCCQTCSQQAFDIKDQSRDWWVGRTQYDSVWLHNWKETIQAIRAMGLCPQCGERH